MATQATTTEQLEEKKKEAEKDALTASLKAKTEAANAKLSGIGLRHFFGFTRGRATTPIEYLAFDESKPDTLPTDTEEFSIATNVTDAGKLMAFLISGFNEAAYREASDPIAEYVDKSWDDAKTLQFRTSVRNLSKMLEMSIDDTAKMVLEKMNKV